MSDLQHTPTTRLNAPNEALQTVIQLCRENMQQTLIQYNVINEKHFLKNLCYKYLFNIWKIYCIAICETKSFKNKSHA